MANMPAIELRCISKNYGAVQALSRVSLRVEPGEVLGFLGPNGAGKTTAIRILFDLIRPAAGQALILGYDCQRQGIEARRNIGYLPGELRLYENLSGRETIDYFANLGQVVERTYLSTLFDRFSFDPDRQVAAYSKGNRQKLGLILAMMHKPAVLILDEPTSGLDPLIQESFAGLLQERAAEGGAVFFSSHVLSEVERMCNKVVIIRQGRIAAVEEISALKGRTLHLLEVTFSEPVPSDVFDLPGVSEVESFKSDRLLIRLEVRDNLDALLKVIARFPVTDLRTDQPSLEELFLAYYQDEPADDAEAAVP